MVVDIRDVITCFKFGDDRFRGLASAEDQILAFPIDFDGRPYNTLTLPCERVIYCMLYRLDWIVQCFTSPPTQYRLYGRRFLQVKRPNQQYQSTEGKSTKDK